MKRELLIQEYILHGFSMKVHVIRVNEEQRGGCYQQITSLEGLINRTSERWYNFYYLARYKEFKSQVRFNRIHKYDLKSHTAQYSRMAEKVGKEEANEMFPLPEYVFHDSVWSFFESIGYDHRNKKVSHTDEFILKEKK